MSLLEMAGVGAGYGDRRVLEGCTLTLEAGEVAALLGPNGSGKTTLLDLAAGLRLPWEGVIRWEGASWGERSRRDRARLVALVPQEFPADLSLTAREYVALGRTPHQPRWGGDTREDAEAVEAALAAAGASAWGPRDVAALSSGERQRVAVARALAQRPRLLCLDEPTNHLDVAAQAEVRRWVRAWKTQGLAVILVTHDLPLAAAVADRVWLLSRGRLAAEGAPRAVLTAARLREVYGVALSVKFHGERDVDIHFEHMTEGGET